jgi:hypothetical protein
MANLKKKLPRVEDIDKYISMTFVGSEQNWEGFQQQRTESFADESMNIEKD